MWAGGAFEWSPEIRLKVGETVTEMSRISDVQYKNNMLFVYQEKTLYPGKLVQPPATGAWSVKEQRIHVFLTNDMVKSRSNAQGRLKRTTIPDESEENLTTIGGCCGVQVQA